MKVLFWCISILFCFFSKGVYAAIPYISLEDAEKLALKTSNEIKAFTSQAYAADEAAGVKFAPLLPTWTIEGYYQYNTHVPSVSLPIPGLSSLPVGTHTPYSIGTTVVYTIWDTFSNLNTYRSAQYFAKSQKETEENTKIQILLETRLAYLKVQLSLEELKAVEDSLKLVRSQFNDMDKKFQAGTVARLDWIDSQREVLSYEVQYEQQRAAVTTNVKSLFALLSLPTTIEIFDQEPDPDRIPEKTPLKIKFDSLDTSLNHANQWLVEAPSEKQPSLLAQTFLAKSYFLQADSEWGKLWPKIDLYANSQIMYPDVIQIRTVNQNSFRASISMPVFDGNRIRHKVAEYKQNALSAQFNHDQIKINLDRDYQINLDLLKNLQVQKAINKQDMEAAQKSAKLYYESYQAGKSLLINVQRANVQVLTTQVQGARIAANILNQLFQLQYLSGKIIL